MCNGSYPPFHDNTVILMMSVYVYEKITNYHFLRRAATSGDSLLMGGNKTKRSHTLKTFKK